MSMETQDGEDGLKKRVVNFLCRNFPQIQMHGGSAAIRDLGRETGEVIVPPGGACSRHGISPVIIQAIRTRVAKEIPEINEVHADISTGGDGGTGGGSRGGSPSLPGNTSDDTTDTEDDQSPQAPF